MYGRDVQVDGVHFPTAYRYVVLSLFTWQITQIEPIFEVEEEVD